MAYDDLIYAIAGTVLFLRLSTAAWRALNFPWHKALVTIREVAVRLPRLWQACQNEDDDVVNAQMTEWEVQHFRSAITLLTATCSFFSVIHLVNIATGTRRMGSVGQDAAFYALYATSVLLDMCPGVITNKTINWALGFLTLIAVVAYLPGICPPQNLSPQIMYANLLFFLLSASQVQVVRVAICNALHTIFWGVRLLLVEVPPGVTFPARSLVLLQCAWIMILVAHTWILRKSLRTSFRKDMEAKMLRGEQFAFKALLRMVCDVVIELDPQLRLVGPAQDLCALLLRGSTQTMEGTPLVEIMPKEEDRDRFLTMCTSHDGPSVTHFSLRDGNGTLIEVEMFSFLFEGLDGESRCFAGLREFSDRAPPAATLSQALADDEVMRLGSMTPESDLMESPQVITLDTGDPHLPIQSISKGLEHLLGATNDSKFIRYLGNSREFTCWMQAQVNIHMFSANNSFEELPAQTTFQVRLRPRFDWARSHIRAVCNLLVDDDCSSTHNSDEADSLLFARFEIHTMHRCPGGFRQRSVRSNNSSNSSHRRKMQARANCSPEQRASLSGIMSL